MTKMRQIPRGAIESTAGLAYPKRDSNPENASEEITVLLVDDSFVALRGMARTLKTQWETDVASDAEEALYMIRKNEYSVVISDCDMPGKDGIWLLEQTAAVSPKTVRILTSGTEQERFSEVISTGLVQCFLKKPVAPEQLSVLLAQLDF